MTFDPSVSVAAAQRAALVFLPRAGYQVGWFSPTVALNGAWMFVIIFGLSALANFASQSSSEQFLMGPTALLLAVSSVVIAHNGDVTSAGSIGGHQPKIITRQSSAPPRCRPHRRRCIAWRTTNRPSLGGSHLDFAPTNALIARPVPAGRSPGACPAGRLLCRRGMAV